MYFLRGSRQLWPHCSQPFFPKKVMFLCSFDRKFPEFSKTHPTFVSSTLLLSFFGTPCRDPSWELVKYSPSLTRCNLNITASNKISRVVDDEGMRGPGIIPARLNIILTTFCYSFQLTKWRTGLKGEIQQDNSATAGNTSPAINEIDLAYSVR